MYQIMASGTLAFGVVAEMIGNSPNAAAGAFVAAGLFAVADAIKARSVKIPKP